MPDLIFVSVSVVFFLTCLGYIRWCDRLMGPQSAQKTQR